MDSLGWFGLVVLFSWWLRVSLADGMGRKFLSDLHGASPVLMDPYLLFLPYLWQDLRTLERAKRLAPLWSAL